MKAWTAADIRKLEKKRNQALVVIDVLTNERDWLRHWLKEQAASEQALREQVATLTAELADCQRERQRNADAAARAIDELAGG